MKLYERIIEEKSLIYEILTEKETKILDFNKLKIVLNREKFLKSLGERKGIFKKEPMKQKDWIIFLNNCYMKQKLVSLNDKKATYLLQSLITEGIPIELRAFAYVIFSGAFLFFRPENKLEYFALIEKANQEVRDQVAKDIIRVHLPYDFTVLANRDIYRKEDVQKTEEIDKKIKEQATNILLAYSVYDPEVAYIQGMASIAVSLVYNFIISKWVFERTKLKNEISFELNFSEEEIFYVFLGIIKNLDVRKYFIDKFQSMNEKIDSFANILKLRHPKILNKLTDNGVRFLSCLTLNLRFLWWFTLLAFI